MILAERGKSQSFCYPYYQTSIGLAVECMVLPVSTKAPLQTYDSVAVCDVSDTRKDLLDVIPVHDVLPTKLVASNILDVGFSKHAEGLSDCHGEGYSVVVLAAGQRSLKEGKRNAGLSIWDRE